MSVNRILSKKTFGSVVAQGKKLTISAAIETTHWWRPEFAADLLKEPLERAIENTPEKIPPWAEDACAREPEHISDEPPPHLTAVLSGKDESGEDKLQSIHLVVPEK